MNLTTVIVLLSLAFTTVGCTHLTEIRTDHYSTPIMSPKSEAELLADCIPGHKTENEIRNSIEDYGDHLIGFVEFDDQGWYYNNGDQLQVLLRRMRSELDNPQNADTGIVTLVFVHGWHHNAHDNDCNVNEFRAMVKLTSDRLKNESEQGPDRRSQKVIGIYVGWRGEAVDAPLLRYTTILDRRSTAEHVAKGSVRELFAEIRKLQYKDQQDSEKAKVKSRMHTIVIGHSFGGLIAYHSLAQALLNDLALTRPTASIDCAPFATPAFSWPNQIVLINPAFEASRFEAIHNAEMPDLGCHYQRDRPRLVVLTAENDGATGKFFPAFRFVSTLFEKYNATSDQTKEDERNTNLHTIGFVDRYKTHHLCLEDGRAVLSEDRRPDSSGTSDPNAPVWVVTATPDIIQGHDGFLYTSHGANYPPPYLLYWLLDVFLKHGSELGQCND